MWDREVILGIRGTGTTRAVSPDWRVFVRVTVRRAPDLVNVTLPLDNTVCEEKVSSERGTRFAVLKKCDETNEKGRPKGQISGIAKVEMGAEL